MILLEPILTTVILSLIFTGILKDTSKEKLYQERLQLRLRLPALVHIRCAIWYYLYNLKNVKNTHGAVLLLVKVKG